MRNPPDILREIESRNDLGPWLTKHGLVDMGTEIGTFAGEFAEIIKRNWEGDLYCVDPWKRFDDGTYPDPFNHYDLENYYNQTVARLARFGDGVTLVRLTSFEAVGSVEDGSLDFAYIDANHTSEACAQDIALWWPKVAKGGLLCGHDFYYKDRAHDVITAVLDFAESIGVRPHVTACTSWWFLKE